MLIGITGRKNSGKDYLYDAIKEIRPEAERLPFADPVKLCLATLLGVSVEILEEWKNDPDVVIVVERKSKPYKHISELTIRHGFQRMGTEVGRNIINKELWINLAFGRKGRDFHQGRIICITDLRFRNEAEAIKRYGGFVVRMYRDAADTEKDGHQSEIMEIPEDMYDYKITNNGTIGDLGLAARAMLAHLEANVELYSV